MNITVVDEDQYESKTPPSSETAPSSKRMKDITEEYNRDLEEDPESVPDNAAVDYDEGVSSSTSYYSMFLFIVIIMLMVCIVFAFRAAFRGVPSSTNVPSYKTDEF